MTKLCDIYIFGTVAVKRATYNSAKVLYWKSHAVVRSAAVLEDAFNLQLIEQHRGGLVLTTAGEKVHRHACSIKAGINGILNIVTLFSLRKPSSSCKMEILFNTRFFKIASLLAESQCIPVVADILGMSNLTISRRLEQIHRELKLTLFIGIDQRNLMLTEVGERLIPLFNEVLTEVDHIDSEIAALKCVSESLSCVKPTNLTLSPLTQNNAD